MKRYKKNQEITVQIKDLAFGGKGIAKVDDFVIFVANTIPGDEVLVRVVNVKSNYAEAKVRSFIKRGNGHIKAPCKYVGHCGGCKWQDLNYSLQLQYKRQQVSDSVERIAQIKDVNVNEIIPSPNTFHYRNKMEFSFSDNRWLLPDELGNMSIPKNFALGFHAPESFSKIIDIDECFLQDDIFNKILNSIKSFVKKSTLPIYNLHNNKGVWRFLMIRKGVHSNEYMINIVTSIPIVDEIKSHILDLLKEIPEITSVVNNLNRRAAQIAQGEEEILIYGKNIIHENLDNFKFEISANSFFQTNTLQAEQLYRYVKNLVREKNLELVYDLYSGTGTIPIYLSDTAKKIIGFEIVASSVENAVSNVDKLGIKNCEFICGDVKKTLLKYSKRPDVLITDPPRDGMHLEVIETILNLLPKHIIYVSCNPATMARDLKKLVSNYSVENIQPFDMFPHTYHIESVVFMKLREKV